MEPAFSGKKTAEPVSERKERYRQNSGGDRHKIPLRAQHHKNHSAAHHPERVSSGLLDAQVRVEEVDHPLTPSLSRRGRGIAVLMFPISWLNLPSLEGR